MGVKVSRKRRQKTVQEGEYIYIIQNITAREKATANDGTSAVRQKFDYKTGENFIEETLDTGSFQLKIIQAGLTSWNLEDEKGVPLPITPENIDIFLPPDHMELLYAEIMHFSRLSEAEKKTSNEQSVKAEE